MDAISLLTDDHRTVKETFTVVKENVQRHIDEEESGIRSSTGESRALGDRMQARRAGLLRAMA